MQLRRSFLESWKNIRLPSKYCDEFGEVESCPFWILEATDNFLNSLSLGTLMKGQIG